MEERVHAGVSLALFSRRRISLVRHAMIVVCPQPVGALCRGLRQLEVIYPERVELLLQDLVQITAIDETADLSISSLREWYLLSSLHPIIRNDSADTDSNEERPRIITFRSGSS